jgi:hypothetical protein
MGLQGLEQVYLYLLYFTVLAQFMKSKKQTVLDGTLCVYGKNCSPVVKNKKLKRGEHRGQHLGDVTVLVCQDKQQVSVIFTYHRSEIHVTINKVNQEEAMPLVVCRYNINMLGEDLKD